MNKRTDSTHLFWTESFWLPVGFTWKDYESTDTLRKAEFHKLLYLPFLVFAVTAIRYLFEWYIAYPICLLIGIKDDQPKKLSNGTSLCENLTSSSKIKKYMQTNRRTRRSARMRKATETCWRSFAYLILFGYGTSVVIRRKWFFDYTKWLPNYIKHPFTWDIEVYYFMEMSFYFSLLFSQFTDTKRKDFMQQFIHHVATLTLLLGSYLLSLYRFGTIIMYLHDSADVWLEPAKLFNYAKKQKLCDVLFIGFAVVFFATRLIYYPGYVSYAYFHYNTLTNSVVFQSLVCLCFVLLFLNFYWGYMVLRLAYKVIMVDQAVVKDNRSDSEDSNDED